MVLLHPFPQGLFRGFRRQVVLDGVFFSVFHNSILSRWQDKQKSLRFLQLQETKACASAVPFLLAQCAPFSHRPFPANRPPLITEGESRPGLLRASPRLAGGSGASRSISQALPRTSRQLSEALWKHRFPINAFFNDDVVILPHYFFFVKVFSKENFVF